MTAFRVIQYLDSNGINVAKVIDHDTVQPLLRPVSLYELALTAMKEKVALSSLIEGSLGDKQVHYPSLIRQQTILAPISHPDPAHCLVSGTGLTHLGSADTRSAMHTKIEQSEENLTDSMKMFKMGVDDGKASAERAASQPEWFYKGNGNIVQPPYQAISAPDFAMDAGEEPELVGVYINDENGNPHRIGFAIANEFSDHVTEKQNYLWLAHSKLRQCSIGPELVIGDIPSSLTGVSRIYREGKVLWEKPFVTGEDNMSHNIANLEHHHFKYDQFRSPGDLNIHFFGTSTLSFGDAISTQDGDIFEISIPEFGRALSNPLKHSKRENVETVQVESL
ncbi:FAH family protein [Veronia nyctiphanis]|uniref:FAH family protein n=1 Tax=Veronia nyctiphanis TaxID=1278244 RepID=A0A4Q0YUD6_9GAMM|nr:AraD1 family protein [Veronia nyctiphanis]RXJ74395.1 FAH family protein [Veronia nyctiphanis]